MKKFIKIALYTILGIILLAIVAGGLFVYKSFYGFNFYDTDPPELSADIGEHSVLVFSK